jgi:hypothetical protein
MDNQSHLNIPNEQLLLINILNTIYNDNLRQINTLTNSNNEIRNIITNLLRNNTNLSNRSQTHNRFRNRNNNYNRNSNQERVYINNLPYIIEDYQEYRIPSSQLYNWINNSTVSSSESSGASQTRTNGNQQRTSSLSRAFQSFFEPVDVFPTQTQIETATRRAMYCDIVSPINRSCPISLENFNDSDMVSVIRYCGHIFHTEHLNRWFARNCRCPVCRYDIRNYTSSVSSNFVSVNETNDASPAPSLQSRPLNESENNPSLLNEERRIPTTQVNSTGRRNTSPYINSFFNNIVNDVNLQDIENIGSIFTDSSGNFTSNFTSNVSDSSVFLTLLSALNNRNTR